MPLNPNIPLSVKGAQPFNALLTGQQARQQQEGGVKRNQLLDLQASGQQINNDRAAAENDIRSSYEGALGLVNILGQEGEVTPDRLDNARSYMQNRISAVEARGGDAEGSRGALALLEQGGIDELRQEPAKLQDIMIRTGLLQAPADNSFTLGVNQRRFDGNNNLVATGPEKLAEPTKIEQLINARDMALQAGDQNRVNLIEKAIAKQTSGTNTDQRTANIKDYEFAQANGFTGSFSDFIKQDKTASKAEEEELKATVKANVSRLSDLKNTKKARDASIAKAQRFLQAFQSDTAESGTTRTMAGMLPGVFTEQAQFDQEFNAFAEVAAREKLKAAGEIRPTDADVEGMKRALFGIGRDEGTNIQLLSEFIEDQKNQNNELDDLIEAKNRGDLSTFTGRSVAVEGLENLSNEELLNF